MSRAQILFAGWVLGCGFAVLAPLHAAATDAVVWSFTGGGDGGRPVAGLIKDSAGNLYGTTTVGGAYGAGAIFEIAANGTETPLHSFGSAGDGEAPDAGLIEDSAGNFYGTTSAGAKGYGAVFKLAADHSTESILYSFTGGSDGGIPVAGLVMDKSGNLYGTASYGGAQGEGYYGVVFKLAPNGTETVLHSFSGGGDGGDPVAGLLLKGRDLYGTTTNGGANGYGTVFRVTTSGVETVLYSFCSRSNCSDGGYPVAGLVKDSAGNFYGTTSGGGGIDGYGTVFKLAPNGTETVLYAFSGGGDGNYPEAGLIRDSAGNLYGTTYKGGTDNFGTVFEVSSGGAENLLYSFTAGNDGAYCLAGLLMGAKGYLYGTTLQGGADNSGTVFKVPK